MGQKSSWYLFRTAKSRFSTTFYAHLPGTTLYSEINDRCEKDIPEDEKIETESAEKSTNQTQTCMQEVEAITKLKEESLANSEEGEEPSEDLIVPTCTEDGNYEMIQNENQCVDVITGVVDEGKKFDAEKGECLEVNADGSGSGSVGFSMFGVFVSVMAVLVAL